jgi:RNA polymerase sigma-B factor
MTPHSAPAARERRRRTKDLFDRAACQPPGDERAETWGEIVVINVPVARGIARRYRDRGCDLEDLEQAACLALVRAVRHFDAASGHDFLTYAVPSIRGEVLRYFRDLGWMVRPPRAIQELQPLLSAEQRKHQEVTGSTLGVDEMAARLGVDPHAVRQALLARGCFSPTSLDLPMGEPGGAVLSDVVPYEDPGFASAEARALLDSLLAHLSERDRWALHMRFVQELTQSEMAEQLALTQPQVCRLIKRILADLREKVAEPGASLLVSA